MRAVYRQCVVYNDVWGPNMLFNMEVNGVMVIDFEQTALLKPPWAALVPVVPNKRARESGKLGSYSGKRLRRMLEDEILMAEQTLMA